MDKRDWMSKVRKTDKRRALSSSSCRLVRLGAMLVALGFFGTGSVMSVEPVDVEGVGVVTLRGEGEDFFPDTAKYLGDDYSGGLRFVNDPQSTGVFDFANQGTIGDDADPMSMVNASAIGTFTNSGSINFSESMSVSALRNTGNAAASPQMKSNDGNLTVAGLLTNGGTIDVGGMVAADQVANETGAVLQGNGSLTVNGLLLNNAGTVQNFETVSVQAGSLVNSGEIANIGNLSAQNISNSQNGVIQTVETLGVTDLLTNFGKMDDLASINAAVSFNNQGIVSNVESISGNETINSTGGTMENIGAVTGKLTNGGTLKRSGNSVGTTNLGGLENQAGGTLAVRVSKSDGALTNDRFIVDGSAAFVDGTLQVSELESSQGGYQAGDRWTFLEAGSLDVDGDPALESSLPLSRLLKLSAWHDNSNYYLEVLRTKNYAEGATTENQRQFGRYLDELGNRFVAGSDLENVLIELDALSPGDGISSAGRHAMAEMDGAVYGSLATLGIEGQTIFNQQLNDIFRPQTLCSTEVCSPCRNLWGKYYGVDGDLDSDGNAAGGSYQVNGVMVGGDMLRRQDECSCFRFGGYFGYGATDFETAGLSERAQSDGYKGGVYFIQARGADYLLGNAHYGWDNYHVKRQITFLNRNHRGDFDGNNVSVRIEKGWNVPLRSAMLQPLLAFQYVWQDTDAFTETGEGMTALSVKGASNSFCRSEVGSRFLVTRAFSQGQMLNLSAKALWLHEYSDTNGETTAQFSNPRSSQFTGIVAPYTVQGNESDRDWCDLGLGADFTVAHMTLFGGYDCLFNGGGHFHTGNVGLACRY